MRGTVTGLALLVRLSALTLGAAFGSLLIGIFLDRTLGIAPFGTLCLMVFGILVGTISTYRTVQQANDAITDDDDRKDSTGGI
ncbi:MAG: AtpZ/AtpI family protein [Chloroflexi bacterium]|nr:AtpZ/AtpI family protein [Chloroflexota bacterium]